MAWNSRDGTCLEEEDDLLPIAGRGGGGLSKFRAYLLEECQGCLGSDLFFLLEEVGVFALAK